MVTFWLGVYFGGLVVTMLFSLIGMTVNSRQGIVPDAIHVMFLSIIGWPVTVVQAAIAVILDKDL